MECMDPTVMGASLLRRISRKSDMTPVVLAQLCKIPPVTLMAAMNGERPLPAKDCVRLSMMSGLEPADVAFEGR